jgi:hypothetical protein
MTKKRKRDPQAELMEAARLFPAFRAHGRQLEVLPEELRTKYPEPPKVDGPDVRNMSDKQEREYLTTRFPALRTRPSAEQIREANKAAIEAQLEHWGNR